jgi:hypothetical protein
VSDRHLRTGTQFVEPAPGAEAPKFSGYDFNLLYYAVTPYMSCRGAAVLYVDQSETAYTFEHFTNFYDAHLTFAE